MLTGFVSRRVVTRKRSPLLFAVAVFLAVAVAADAQLPPAQPETPAAEEPAPPVAADEPKPEMERPTVWGEPTEVRIGIYIIDVDEINSADQSFAASVYYEARWYSPLLAHEGPGPMHRRLTDIWTPRLVIVNQQMAWSAFPESAEIFPDGEVVFRQKVWGRFSQPLELQRFPSDQQTLSVHITAAGLRASEVEIVPLKTREGVPASGIAQRFSLPDWEVLSYEAEPEPYVPGEGGASLPGFEMRIHVSRQLAYWVIKVIIPLCLIVSMSWAPFWIDPEQIGANIGISTTSFLTLVAYLFAISVLLPPVSYITRMDRFVVSSTLLVFAGLIQAVISAGLVKKGKTHLAERVDHWSRVIYPLALVAVLVAAFAT